MVEYNAGVEAGKRMATSGKITRALCLMHVPDHSVLLDRCNGFQAGVAAGHNAIEYLDSIDVPDDNENLFVQIVEDFMTTTGNNNWEGLGIMLAGQPQGKPGLTVKERHPEVLLGSFDTSDLHYQAIEEGKMLFTMDQGPYLQGYLPIPLLAWQLYAQQALLNHLVESGPAFITKAPSDKQKVCEANHFASCALEEKRETCGGDRCPDGFVKDEDEEEDDKNLEDAAVIALSVIVGVFGLAIIYLIMRVRTLHKHVSELKAQGKVLPNLGMQHYMGSMVKSVDKVVATESEDDPDMS